jgi:hypothetical protein
MNVLIFTKKILNIWKTAVMWKQLFINTSQIWTWIYLHSMNPKQVNTLDIEQVKKTSHTYSSCWYNTISLTLIYVSFSFCSYIKVFIYRVE